MAVALLRRAARSAVPSMNMKLHSNGPVINGTCECSLALGLSQNKIILHVDLPYDVGPARVFLGEAEKTRCVV